MEQKNRIDHYKIQSVLLWFGICFLLQILLLLMQEFQYDGEHYQPLLYLFGKKYGKNAFYATSETMMFLTQLTYCIMVIRRIAKKREENAYMIIPRYKSFRAYYGSVYRELVGYTFLYQTAILTGSIVGYRLVWYTHHVQAFDERQFLGSQVCMLMGELFFGAVMSIFILRWNALRGAIVIYPGIPMISYYLGSSLPVKWSNLLPGNWLMAARSNLVSKGGYSMAAALFVELLLFVLCSCLLVNMRPGLERK